MSGSAMDALAALGIDPDEVMEEYEATRPKTVRNGLICICGHPVARHTEVAGVGVCTPSRMVCPCRTPRAVADSADVRLFQYRTDGSGIRHALIRGLTAVANAGKEAHWIVDLVCDNPECGSPTNVVPVPVTSSGSPTDEPSPLNVFLCSECRVGTLR